MTTSDCEMAPGPRVGCCLVCLGICCWRARVHCAHWDHRPKPVGRADPWSQTSSQVTPLHLAAGAGSLPLIRSLLAAVREGRSKAGRACSEDWEDLAPRACVTEYLDWQDVDGDTALHAGALDNDAARVRERAQEREERRGSETLDEPKASRSCAVKQRREP